MKPIITTLKQLGSAFFDPGTERPLHMPAPLAALNEHVRALALLATRLYLADVFVSSGVQKLRDWDSTLSLFDDYYHVPLLPPHLAAYLGAGGELIFPALLVLGLGSRFAAAGLSVVNLIAALSLPDIDPGALRSHQLWGAMALTLLLWGSGRWSFDAWLAGRRAMSPVSKIGEQPV